MTSLLIGVLLYCCTPVNLPPVALFSTDPHQGDSITAFYLDARNTYDPESPAYGIKIRWDWNSDSIWDTDYEGDKEFVIRFNSPGWNHITMEAMDIDGNLSYAYDSILIFEGNGFIDTLTDPRDGQRYQIAKINFQWMMTENLRYGTPVNTAIFHSDNDIIEYYQYLNQNNLNNYGGLYTYDEINSYSSGEDRSGICPPGWHIPSYDEWQNSLSIFPHNKADMNYYLGPDSPSGFNLELLGFMYYTEPPDSLFSWYPSNTVAYWCNDIPAPYLEDPDLFISSVRFFGNMWEKRILRYHLDDFWDERVLLRFACYLRCFKD